MGTYNDAFKRAITEGTDTENVFPWQHSSISDRETPLPVRPKKQPGEPAFIRHLPQGVLSEYRIIVENIRSAIKSKPIQIIGFTSPVPHQGVTTSLSVIASLFARERSLQNRPTGPNVMHQLIAAPVLLMDTCFARASLHSSFQIHMKEGLSEVLCKNSTTINNAIYETGIFDLHLLPAGQFNEFQFTQGVMDRFQRLVLNLRRQYAYIFVDVAPVLRDADGLAVSKLCDALLLVVKAGETRYEIVQESKKLLDSADVPIIGQILNQREFHVPRWLYKKL